MRVRLHAWSRTITLVPWHEAGEPRSDAATLELGELRRLIADEPGVAASLRAMLHELGDVAGLASITDDELAELVLSQIGRWRLRVESEPLVPMSSDVVVPAYVPQWEREPLEIPENDDHWIEVELLDESEQPVFGERCRIVLPDGREVYERTDRNGLVRVDRTVVGQCTISFPDLDAGALGQLTRIARQGTQIAPTKPKSPKRHWIEVELVGEDGVAIANERCEITLPDGTIVMRKTNADGLVRIAKLTEAGDCQIRFPDIDAGAVQALTNVDRQGSQAAGPVVLASKPKTHWVEVELLGEDGVGIAGERCEITLPDGQVLMRKTDAQGLIRIARLAEAGDCQIRFPDIDAGAVQALTKVDRQGSQAAGPVVLASKPKTHWVEVELLGEDGVGIAGERCEITLPDGQMLTRKTDAQGLIRIARLTEPGDCQISFPELDASTWGGDVPALLVGGKLAGDQSAAAMTSKRSSAHWVEVQLVDESGVGIAGAVCEITLPDGETIRRKTDAGGVIRVAKLAEAGDCQIRFVDIDAAAWEASKDPRDRLRTEPRTAASRPRAR
jgi:phage tail tube protein FII